MTPNLGVGTIDELGFIDLEFRNPRAAVDATDEHPSFTWIRGIPSLLADQVDAHQLWICPCDLEMDVPTDSL